MKHIILLHGALGLKSNFNNLLPLIQQNNYQVHTLNFHGHGGQPDTPEDFSIPLFANQVLQYMTDHKIETTTLLGYSMGGFVATYIACYFPDKVQKVITFGTKFEWTPEVAAKELRMMDPEQILLKVPAFAEKLQAEHHPGDWKQLLAKTGKMLQGLGADNPLKQEQLTQIQTPFLITIGDRDKMIPLDECIRVYRSLPNSSLAVLPATGHLIEQLNWELFVGISGVKCL